jgi:hypothetical protein
LDLVIKQKINTVFKNCFVLDNLQPIAVIEDEYISAEDADDIFGNNSTNESKTIFQNNNEYESKLKTERKRKKKKKFKSLIKKEEYLLKQ